MVPRLRTRYDRKAAEGRIKMKYQTTNDLPPTIRDVLPEDAQQKYVSAYNQAWDAYEEEPTVGQSREALAHQQGWLAVRHEYVLDQGTGQWHRKGEKPQEKEEPQGLIERIRSLF
jgi:cation transport regulator